ncbi:FAD-binding protein [Candidatus Woesearchaeota archaeon]|nr:FAD-binding protein [Candidatus Woesearchaeota archaeon]
MLSIRTYQTEVLIIGSGGAGLRCALELHDKKRDVLVVGKCEKRDAHTILATGGINAALGTMDPQDSWQLHAADTIRDGGLINNPKAVMTLCKAAPRAILELVTWGANFHREKNGNITQRFFGAATYRRACFIGDHTGREILNVLVDQVEQRKIPFLSQVYIFSLLHSSQGVYGAVGWDIRKGTFVVIQAKAVVLATGGHSRMFSRSSSRFWENTGDGIGLAYRCGAQFMDMEMFQFHPTGMVYPENAAGVLVTEAVRGEGGILLNTHGERFMRRYDPARMELSARDVVARAIYTEVQAGRGTQHGGVWLDITHKPKDYILQRLPKVYAQFQHFLGIDISKKPMEVGPTAHYSMGGLWTNYTTGQTSVKHLYAIGEVTSGMHGANRLGGNSLAEIMVFGRLTGEALARKVKRQRWRSLNKKTVDTLISTFSQQFKNKRGNDPLKVKQDLMQMMWEHVGVVRNGKQIAAGLQLLEQFKKTSLFVHGPLPMNAKLLAALDLQHMLPTCEMILKSALYRTESRGAHYRSDHPTILSSWRKNVYCTPTRQGLRLFTKPVAKIPNTIQRLILEKQPTTHLLE